MTYQLNRAVFEPARFLADDWQRQPRVFRQAFSRFEDPITPDELAGVALEPGVDSRLIDNADGQWKLKHGPIDDFSGVGATHWSLLVQAVNEHFPPAQSLLRAFRFLPDWRIDDLMVSYSTPGGGVGAHLDQYDVFIIQGQGERRWQIGLPGTYETITPHPEIKQIAGFEPVIDVVLAAGDMIYIPAGFPHAGESISECLNYSVGFRAPSQAELVSALADHALENDALTKRYQDPTPLGTEQAHSVSWHLTAEHLQQFRELIRAGIADDALLDQVIAKHLSYNPRPPLLVWPSDALTDTTVQRYVERSPVLQRAVGLRMITCDIGGCLVGLVQGQEYELDGPSSELFEILLNTELEISTAVIAPMLKQPSARSLMRNLLNEGFWFVPDEA